MGAERNIATLDTFGDGAGPLFVCEHASRSLPARFDRLGLDPATRRSHVAWDPGALPLARAMADRFAGRLIHARVSRLVYDLNRPPEAVDAIPAQSEIHVIPGNRSLSEAARADRIEAYHLPWVAALGAALTPPPVALVTVHSFTPVYFGAHRDTRIGILHDADSRLADAMLAEAGRQGVAAERNRPYGPEDGVTYTLRRFALPRGLPNVMIEVRNDLLSGPGAIAAMAAILCGLLEPALTRVLSAEGLVP